MSARTLVYFLIALASGLAGATLALHHPLWPLGMLVLLALVAELVAVYPPVWLLLVPALLPAMNFAPWTGWIAFDEMDIVLLGVLLGGYGRLAFAGVAQEKAGRTRLSGRFAALFAVLALSGVVSLLRGVADAGGWRFDWFGAYDHAMNCVRVFKSLAFALLLWPLLARQMRSNAARAENWWAVGMVLGLLWVGLAVLWERVSMVGLWNFASNYRTVATFWEMHVGGAAIDAYLAIATPFALWALVAAKRPVTWLAASALTLLTGYACLTTFSRGVYLAAGMQLLLLVALYRHNTRWTAMWARWRLVGTLVVAALLVVEVVAVLGGNSFMDKRIASSTQDMGNRLEHWHSGLGLLKSPWDWGVGRGLGRIPTNYSNQVHGEDFSGSVDLRSEMLGDATQRQFVRLASPQDLDDLPGVYALTQRIEPHRGAMHVFQVAVRIRTAIDLSVLLCQRHLLYDRICQSVELRVEAPFNTWQTISVPLEGPPLLGSSLPITLALSVDTPGAAADVAQLQLLSDKGEKLLLNGDFSQDMAHWWPAAQGYFVPWHIDNLYLEVLIERGWLGVLALAVLMAWALASFLLDKAMRNPVTTCMVTGLLGVGSVGLVSSVMDVPRVALLLYLLPMGLIAKSAKS